MLQSQSEVRPQRSSELERAVNAGLVARLRCPVSRQPLRPMTGVELAEINSRVGQGGLKFRSGARVERKIESGLVAGNYAYVIEQGIFCLLPGTALVLNAESSLAEESSDKRNVRNFYERVGWTANEEGHFEDALRYEDLRPVSRDYVHRCHLRLNRYLQGRGDGFLLDVASGPVQYPEYLTYAEGFAHRICADISFAALRMARKKLGDAAFYLQADITNLPFVDEGVEGIVSLHTIYHVPADEQARAFSEINRVLRAYGSAVAVYSWNSPAMSLALLPITGARWGWRLLRRFLPARQPTLFSHTYDYSWFKRQPWFQGAELHAWRSVSVMFMRLYIHPRFFGERILDAIYQLEERFPEWAARLGAYPVFVFRK